MKRLSTLIITLALLALACNLGSSAAPTAEAVSIPTQPAAPQGQPAGGQEPCGDGVCDAAEQADPNLCPADCAAAGAETAPGEVETAEPPAEALPNDLIFIPDPGIRIEAAAQPSPSIAEDGTIYVFYADTSAEQPRTLVASSSDGLDFSEGVDPNTVPALHPHANQLPDGTWRLFMFDPQTGALSSRSSLDGIYNNFTDDEGVRYTAPDEHTKIGVWDEHVNAAGEVILLYIGDMAGTDPHIRQAISTDGGWTFSFHEDNPLGDSGSGHGYSHVDPKFTLLPDGRARLFTMVQGENPIPGQQACCNIYSFITEDGGYTFTQEPGVRLSTDDFTEFSVWSLNDPWVIRLPDGRYRMYVAALIDDGSGETIWGVVSATTPDAHAQPGEALPSTPAPEVAELENDPGAEMYLRETTDPLEHEVYLSQINTTSAADSAWQYQTSLVATMPSGQDYDMGAFCRTFQRADGNGYDVVYGGTFRNRSTGETHYSGDVYRSLGNDFSFTTTPVEFSDRGGDLGTDSDGQYYYLLNGDKEDWRLRKYSLDFQPLAETVITLPEKHFSNDQMLRVFNGYVFASGMYDPNFEGTKEPGAAQPANQDQNQFTHLWIYDTDLNYVDDVILDDSPNINGGTLLYYEGTYAYIAADNFFRNTLVALRYDEAWNYLETVVLQADAQWSMGAVYKDGLIYVAYHKGQHGQGDIYVDIYDTSWNLQETIEVTQVDKQFFNAQRPWIQIYDDLMLVSYDVGRDYENVFDLQCVISAYTRR